MLNIRAMEEKDIPQVEEIEKKIFSLPWSEKSFHDACSDENNIYLVCEDEGAFTGYCGFDAAMEISTCSISDLTTLL